MCLTVLCILLWLSSFFQGITSTGLMCLMVVHQVWIQGSVQCGKWQNVMKECASSSVSHNQSARGFLLSLHIFHFPPVSPGTLSLRCLTRSFFLELEARPSTWGERALAKFRRDADLPFLA